MSLESSLHIELLREQLALHVQHSALLEERVRANRAALAAVPEGTVPSSPSPLLFCVGKAGFVTVPRRGVRALLQDENQRVWQEIEEVQRKITKISREMDFEIELEKMERKNG